MKKSEAPSARLLRRSSQVIIQQGQLSRTSRAGLQRQTLPLHAAGELSLGSSVDSNLDH